MLRYVDKVCPKQERPYRSLYVIYFFPDLYETLHETNNKVTCERPISDTIHVMDGPTYFVLEPEVLKLSGDSCETTH